MVTPVIIQFKFNQKLTFASRSTSLIVIVIVTASVKSPDHNLFNTKFIKYQGSFLYLYLPPKEKRKSDFIRQVIGKSVDFYGTAIYIEKGSKFVNFFISASETTRVLAGLL